MSQSCVIFLESDLQPSNLNSCLLNKQFKHRSKRGKSSENKNVFNEEDKEDSDSFEGARSKALKTHIGPLLSPELTSQKKLKQVRTEHNLVEAR